MYFTWFLQLIEKNPKSVAKMKFKPLYAAQSALETGWGGGRVFQQANNMYGVKCAQCDPRTGITRNKNGCKGRKSMAFKDDCEGDRFLVFDNPSQSFIHQIKFLQEPSKVNYAECFEKAKSKPSYKKLTAKSTKAAFDKTDLAYVCDCIHSKGYATNKLYGSHLKNLIFDYDLHLKM